MENGSFDFVESRHTDSAILMRTAESALVPFLDLDPGSSEGREGQVHEASHTKNRRGFAIFWERRVETYDEQFGAVAIATIWYHRIVAVLPPVHAAGTHQGEAH